MIGSTNNMASPIPHPTALAPFASPTNLNLPPEVAPAGELIPSVVACRVVAAHSGTYVPLIRGAHNESLMLSNGRAGGQDWGGPHLVVGRLLLGHTVRQEGAGGGRQVIIRTVA